jgi:uncharacterized surface protein with fasciclin (FAS1) repeats
MRQKKDSILINVCDLPNEKIEGLGISFRSIGRRCNNITKEYLSVPANDNSKITIKNISAGNGRIHIIDTVLMPPLTD